MKIRTVVIISLLLVTAFATSIVFTPINKVYASSHHPKLDVYSFGSQSNSASTTCTLSTNFDNEEIIVLVGAEFVGSSPNPIINNITDNLGIHLNWHERPHPSGFQWVYMNAIAYDLQEFYASWTSHGNIIISGTFNENTYGGLVCSSWRYVNPLHPFDPIVSLPTAVNSDSTSVNTLSTTVSTSDVNDSLFVWNFPGGGASSPPNDTPKDIGNGGAITPTEYYGYPNTTLSSATETYMISSSTPQGMEFDALCPMGDICGAPNIYMNQSLSETFPTTETIQYAINGIFQHLADLTEQFHFNVAFTVGQLFVKMINVAFSLRELLSIGQLIQVYISDDFYTFLEGLCLFTCSPTTSITTTTNNEPVCVSGTCILTGGAFLWLFPLVLGGLFGLIGVYTGSIMAIGLGTLGGIVPDWVAIILIIAIIYLILKKGI